MLRGLSGARWLSTAACTSLAKSASIVAVESSGSRAMHSEMVRRTGSAACSTATGRALFSITISAPLRTALEQRSEVTRRFRVRYMDDVLGHDTIYPPSFCLGPRVRLIDKIWARGRNLSRSGAFLPVRPMRFPLIRTHLRTVGLILMGLAVGGVGLRMGRTRESGMRATRTGASGRQAGCHQARGRQAGREQDVEQYIKAAGGAKTLSKVNR